MALSWPGKAVVAAVGLAAVLAIAGCAPSAWDEAGSAATPSAAAGGDPVEQDEGSAVADGDDDPAQDRVRTGPVAEYGGPAYGDQGTAEVLEPGRWCKTIAVFWGGDPVPPGVSFTFEDAVADQPGLEIEGAVCGTRGADRSCLGMTVRTDDSGVFCSLVLQPGEDFQSGTTLTFTGTLECPSAQICDAVAARQVDPGPPIVVDDPEQGDGQGQSLHRRPQESA